MPRSPLPSVQTTLTMRIEKQSSSADRSGRYSVQFDDGSVLRLYRQTVEDFALYPGKELSENEFSALREAAGKMSAKMRAVRIISASNVSKRDLQQRLILKGESPQDAAQAVSWLGDMNLLDDSKTAEQIVHSCISKGYGLARAKQALFEKRIPKSLWDKALEDYPVQDEAILDFLKSRLKDTYDAKAVKKSVDALMRRGHNYADIRRALNRLSSELSDYLEEE